MAEDICPECRTAETILMGKKMICKRCYELGQAEFDYLEAEDRLIKIKEKNG